jgi:hypothetical protein
MIKVVLKGRMGNQLFQFAHAWILSKKKRTSMVVRPISVSGYRLNFFSLPILGGGLPSRVLLFLQNIIWNIFPAHKKITENSCFYRFAEPGEEKNIEVEGFFQDGRAFVPYQKELKKIYKVKKKLFHTFKKKYGHLLNQKNLVLNLRIADDYKTAFFEEINSNGLLPLDWYSNTLNQIDFSQFDNLIVIADNIEEAKTKLNLEKYSPLYIDDNIVTDFLFLLTGDCLIIPNSSFSWWGAFLNDRPNKKVYAPINWVGYHVGIEYPAGIMINEFEWV